MDDVNKLGRITRVLLPILGKPNIAKTVSSSGTVDYKITGWQIKGVGDFIKVYEALKKENLLTFEFENFDFPVTFNIETDWYMPSFFTSDDPAVWHRLNEEKKAKVEKTRQHREDTWEERMRLREVNTALTGTCSFHGDGNIKQNRCVSCEYQKYRKKVPNRYHSSVYSDYSAHIPATCQQCKQETEFNENYGKPAPAKLNSDVPDFYLP
jgi:hypothetical protein